MNKCGLMLLFRPHLGTRTLINTVFLLMPQLELERHFFTQSSYTPQEICEIVLLLLQGLQQEAELLNLYSRYLR
jgi:hypothetical protein